MMKYNKVTELHMARLDTLDFFDIFPITGIYHQPISQFYRLREYVYVTLVLQYLIVFYCSYRTSHSLIK